MRSFILASLVVFTILACTAPSVATPLIENPTLTTPRPTAQLVATNVPVVATPAPESTPEPTAMVVPTSAPQPTASLEPTKATTPTDTPSLTNTPEPTSTPEPPQLGARTNPVPFGQVVEILEGDIPSWAIVVSDANPDATEQLFEAYQSNDPPEPGNQFYMLKIEIKYLGSDSAKFSDRYFLQAVGQSGVVYRPYCDSSYPDWIELNTELFTGGAIEGWQCWAIPIADVDSLQLLVDRYFSDTRIWMDLK